MYCNGCAGKGWVDSKVIGPTLCPVCKGVGMKKVEETAYDQDAVWLKLRDGTHKGIEDILDRESESIENWGKDHNDILVHLLFNRSVTPHGNIIFYHLQHSTITGGKVPKLSSDEIVSRNYCTDEDGKIRTWKSVPVSPAIWDLMRMLGSDERLITWSLDANRKGNPLFCDENMLAFSLVPKSKEDVIPLLSDVEVLFREKHCTEISNLSLCLLP